MIKSRIIFCIPSSCFWKVVLFLSLGCHFVMDNL